MSWPLYYWLVQAPGVAPHTCESKEAALGKAKFISDNGAWDIEIQVYKSLGKSQKWAPKTAPATAPRGKKDEKGK